MSAIVKMMISSGIPIFGNINFLGRPQWPGGQNTAVIVEL
jgi:hypothetical protein